MKGEQVSMSSTIQRISKKVCLLGDFSVGKTSLVSRFVYDRFDEKYLSTLGVKVSRKVVDVVGQAGTVELSILLWDLAGGEDGSIMTPSYLHGTAGAILVCDMTRTETLAGLYRYLSQLRAVAPSVVAVLAANKLDLVDSHVMTSHDVDHVAQQLGLVSVFTSAKTGEGVEELFLELSRRLVPLEHEG